MSLQHDGKHLGGPNFPRDDGKCTIYQNGSVPRSQSFDQRAVEEHQMGSAVFLY